MASPCLASEWTPGVVADWLCARGFSQHAGYFKEQDISGKILLGLTDDDLKTLNVINCDDRTVMLKCIQCLALCDVPVVQPAGFWAPRETKVCAPLSQDPLYTADPWVPRDIEERIVLPSALLPNSSGLLQEEY